MLKPTLVILAAGMGSRYGGLKQIDPVDEEGNKIIDFSIYDAIKVGFDEVVFIIKEAIKDDFIAEVGKNVEKYVKVKYVYQELDKLPKGFSLDPNRVKPWGTAHALLCCKDVLTKPFCVINSDDFYGREAFDKIAYFLTSVKTDTKMHFSMVGYLLGNTLTDNGTVTRGVCKQDNGFLTDIVETKNLAADGDLVSYKLGDTINHLTKDTLVSMNFWGLTPEIFKYLEEGFIEFLTNTKDILTDEFYLPIFIDTLIKSNKADVRVLSTDAKWFGVTYKEDKEEVVASIKKLKDNNVYPERLW